MRSVGPQKKPHREDGNNVEQRHTKRTRSMSVKQAQTNGYDVFDEAYDDTWPSRMPTSTRRYQSDVRSETERAKGDTQVPAPQNSRTSSMQKSSIPARRTATQVDLPVVQGTRRRPPDTDDDVEEARTPTRTGRTGSLPSPRGHRSPRFHWLFYAGLAMIVIVVLWFLLNSFLSWWQVTQDDWHYGRPRTFQTDAVVGHNDSTTPSHFVAMNFNRHIEIIEFPGGDASKAKIYIGPVLIGQGQDLAVVTLTFKDVNGDGKPDMIVNVQSSRFVFINDNGSFRPARPGEAIQST